jgi:hypothetical protein
MRLLRRLSSLAEKMFSRFSMQPGRPCNDLIAASLRDFVVASPSLFMLSIAKNLVFRSG